MLITIDITNETLSEKDGNKRYDYFFLDKSTGNVYNVISGGAGCLARSIGEVEKLVAHKFSVKQIQKTIKSHKKYFN